MKEEKDIQYHKDDPMMGPCKLIQKFVPLNKAIPVVDPPKPVNLIDYITKELDPILHELSAYNQELTVMHQELHTLTSQLNLMRESILSLHSKFNEIMSARKTTKNKKKKHAKKTLRKK